MTEEEKKAVEIIKGLAVYYDDYSLLDEEEIEENESVNKSIELILNLIEKLQKENEKALAEYMEWQKQELEQKDKIIDLMAEDIDGFQMECNRYFKDKEEVKQYFINKAKEIR